MAPKTEPLISFFTKYDGVNQKILSKVIGVVPTCISEWKRKGKIPEKQLKKMKTLKKEVMKNDHPAILFRMLARRYESDETDFWTVFGH